MKIIMGSPVKGKELKNAVKVHLEAQGHEIVDVGCFSTEKFVKYPSIGERVAHALQIGEAELAINCCGSGTGASMGANKFKGVLACSCESVQTAKLIRVVNGANCLCMGEGVVSKELGCEMADAFINAKFQDVDGIPADVLDFWAEASDEMIARGETATEREIETLQSRDIIVNIDANDLLTAPVGVTKNALKMYTLQNKHGLKVRICNYGATITEIHTPDRDGKFKDIVLGFDKPERYLDRHPYFGALIGRYANRIAKGEFRLNGKKYQLEANEMPRQYNHLHGGITGFSRVCWKAEINDTANKIEFSYFSKDGESGYPGNLFVKAIYTLSDKNELKMEYTAFSDKDTIVNLTNHSYFNLAGEGSGDIKKQLLKINADTFTPVTSSLIPTGEYCSVLDTPLDFRDFREIGERLNDDFEQMELTLGYDHNFVLAKKIDGAYKSAAIARDPESGRCLEVLTTMPGLQFYSGNYLNNIEAKNGSVYNKNDGFCLEPQYFPDSPNCDKFPDITLKAEEKYQETIVYRFFTDKSK